MFFFYRFESLVMPLSSHLLSFATSAYCWTLNSQMDIQLRSTYNKAHFYPRWIARINRFLLRPTICQLVRAFVISQLNYGNSLLVVRFGIYSSSNGKRSKWPSVLVVPELHSCVDGRLPLARLHHRFPTSCVGCGELG